ncbi:MerR family transcriptional regulator [Cellulomonas shaoxiangyii]|uniref:MerR family transcriptional regulator n=1 Tax=Cellulomonas shaoxiangyii TaxID=2566013 RepID=A0A4P7SGZ8_9CELL|nr:MerR family transcriptional regulator [Cellulomonas shaoxiangyii]QCB92961.1 MerR family transcriptional regulator [Cellulomonas shaoxiangyii]TGY79877.1 MerR family transcriptional regulator [Cellulomonas shaoxiangyii]
MTEPYDATTGDPASSVARGTAVEDAAAGDQAEEAPDREAAAPGAAPLTVAAVARRLGVAPATLRTWDRRYGLGPSEHSAGAHRRYSPRDLDRLLVMRRLTIEGVAPGEAARLALSSDPDAAAPAFPTSTDVTGRLPGGGSGTADHADGAGRGTAGDGASDGAGSRAAVEARTGVTPSTAAAVVAVVDAALAGRADRCAGLLAVTAPDGVAGWWTGLVEPAMRALARRTVVERPGVDAYATLAAAALGALRAHTAQEPAPGAPVVLVLPVPGEPRPLVVHALAAALVGGGVDARLVGGPVSTRHAGELAVMTRARAVVTVAEGPAPDLSVVARLAQERPDLPQYVMVADTAAERVPLDRSVHRARTFVGLLHEALAAVGESSPV